MNSPPSITAVISFIAFRGNSDTPCLVISFRFAYDQHSSRPRPHGSYLPSPLPGELNAAHIFLPVPVPGFLLIPYPRRRKTRSRRRTTPEHPPSRYLVSIGVEKIAYSSHREAIEAAIKSTRAHASPGHKSLRTDPSIPLIAGNH
ncbi:hypothetical protein BDQ17DRAFT_1423842 [Cyathus striatus]|nr:hypothetical protein BDQ17DRAFT_1423842 [Cyathus striatus]